MPLSLLEAMAIGKPCIASDIGPVAEIIKNGDTGILFKPRDEKDMERAMFTLIRDAELARALGVKGRAFVMKNFDPLKEIKHLEELYLSLS